jgi:hypothetical protein
MSEETTRRRVQDEHAIDRLLRDACMDDTDLDERTSIRSELLELRSLASTAPLPSAAVRALMTGSPAPLTTRIAAADGPLAGSATPTAVLTTVTPGDGVVQADELAARRRHKRSSMLAGLAVAVTLAGGATAAAASEGGLPGALQYLGAAIGSVVSPVAPGSGNTPMPVGPVGSGSGSAPGDGETQPTPAQAQTVPATPKAPSGVTHTAPQQTPGQTQGGQRPSRMPTIPAVGEPGNTAIPTGPPLDAPQFDAPKDISVPLSPQLFPPATLDMAR